MQPESQITLDQYAAQIVRPMVIEGIKLGRFDDVLADPDVLLIALKDDDVLKVVEERLIRLSQKW